MHIDIIQNKYYTWYQQLIKSRRRVIESKEKYFEIHHILPKSMGGSNHDENLIKLTPREHYIAHLLLLKCCTSGSKVKMMQALTCMSGTNEFAKMNARKYEFARMLIQKIYYQIGKQQKQEAKLHSEVLNEYTDLSKAYERGLCKECKIRPRAINYIKNERTYYRSKCNICSENSSQKLTVPRWVINGYIKKCSCEYCGFVAKFEEQLTVFDLGKTYKTACLNCRVALKLMPTKPEPDF